MRHKNLSYMAVTAAYLIATAAGAADIVGNPVDMQNYQGARCIATLGALSAGQQTQIVCEQSDDMGVTDAWTQCAASGYAADGDSNKLLILEVTEPAKRYIRFTVKRAGANAVLASATVELFRPRVEPLAPDVSVSKQAVVQAS